MDFLSDKFKTTKRKNSPMMLITTTPYSCSDWLWKHYLKCMKAMKESDKQEKYFVCNFEIDKDEQFGDV